MAGELGFEPRQYESESQVLPLHNSPILAPDLADKKYYIASVGFCQQVILRFFYFQTDSEIEAIKRA